MMSEAWNGGESVHYVDHADRYDLQLAPFADALLNRACLARHESVLDIGCGCGVTTFAASRQCLRAVGVDISTPLLEIAGHRARIASLDNVEFIDADAQTYPFDAGLFDAVISQFGLMFFDDPAMAFGAFDVHSCEPVVSHSSRGNRSKPTTGSCKLAASLHCTPSCPRSVGWRAGQACSVNDPQEIAALGSTQLGLSKSTSSRSLHQSSLRGRRNDR